MARLHVPFRHLRPLDSHPSQCLMATQSAVGALYQANPYKNLLGVCPAAASQASVVHWMVCKLGQLYA